MGKKKTREDFIQDAIEKHGDKYDYSKVEYVKSNIKVCIICSEHGEFWQKPSNHLNRQGCPKCGNENKGEYCRSSKEGFIKKAGKVHGDKYDYSKVEYVNCMTKVCISCSEHGEFCQTPTNHLNGHGCPKCKGDKTRKRCTSTKKVFIKKARLKHGDKYNYSKVDYVNSDTKVCIICPEHGEFWQRPNNHTRGDGCPKCGQIATADSRRSSLSDFIRKARETHGDNYDYSNVKYNNCETKVCIICKEHGEFWQAPSNHINGQGCPKCNLSHLERSVMTYLDGMGITYDYQKRFDWLVKQSLDFYLPDYNVGIECQGEQHFFPIDFAGKGVEWACKQFDKTVSLDKRKKKLCEKHGMKLLYFGNTPNYNTFLSEVVHDNMEYLIDYLNENKLNIT